MTEATRIRAQVQDGKTVVRVLMAHDMESGQRKDGAGRLIAPWYIQEVTAAWNGKVVMTAEWGPAISRNPFLQFNIKGAKVGDRISISWIDSRGERRTDDAVVAS